MIASKYVTKIGIVLTVIIVCLCFCCVAFQDKLIPLINDGVSMEYENKLFNTDDIISVNIIMDKSKWSEMLENATAEKYYQCNVEINGELFENVGIRPKGNTSLSAIANNPDTDRYSFKLEFDQYDTNQSCYGLDKLILNNNYADNTNMKEALVYDMYRYIGADAPLYNYAKISLNNEYWGLYLALEAVEDSFLLRNYGASGGELYKPDSMDIGGGKKNSKAEEKGEESKDGENKIPAPPENSQDIPQPPNEQRNSKGDRGMPDGNMGRGSKGGANLNYTDDDLDSYSTIWDSEVTDTNTADHKRVVTALKNISQGSDLEKYMDIDNLLKFMAVHIFSVNQDSLSGNMAHNYYLYENNGQLNMIPWDYNLAFGGMSGGNGTGVVNDAVDMPFSSTRFFDKLLENDEYLSIYHNYLSQLVTEYVDGGKFDEFYQRTRSQIDDLVKSDPNAFVTYDEYEKAAETLYELVKLRGVSIVGQLDGSIPSTEEEQRQNSENLIDASHINLDLLGGMNKGDELRQHMNTTKEGNGEKEKTNDNTSVVKTDTAEKFDNIGRDKQDSMTNTNENAEINKGGFLVFVKTYSSSVISVILLFFAIVFVKLYKRRSY